jgi:hypothetical protein
MADTTFQGPAALVILGVSTFVTFGSMAWLYRKNEADHERLQKQLNALGTRLTTHEQDNTRHIRPAPLAGASRPRFILPEDEAPTLRSPRPAYS